MEIVNLSQNDDMIAFARKCNTNFKRLAWSSSKAAKALPQEMAAAIAALNQTLSNAINVTIPNRVTEEVAEQDIPGKVSRAVREAYPPVGSYMMSDTSPASSYMGTTWSRSGSVATTGGTEIPLWKRTN